MKTPERIWAWAWQTVPMGQWGVNPSPASVEYIRADLAAVPAQVRDHEQDLIIRDLTMMLIRAARYVPDDQMEGVFDYMRRKGIDHGPLLAAIEPQPDPRDEVIARLVEAVEAIADYGTILTSNKNHDELRAALAAAKAVQK